MRSLHMAAAAALGALVLAGCTAARGAAQTPPTTKTTWSTAVNIANPAIGINWTSRLTFTGDGHAVAVLDGRYDGQLATVLAADPGSSTFAKLGDALLLAAPAPYGADGVAYLRTPTPAPSANPWDSIDQAPVTELGVSLGTVPGSLGELQPLASFRGTPRDAVAAIAGTPRGDIAVAWVQPAGKRALLRFALRVAGQGFGPAQTIAQSRDITDVALAYGAGGDLVVAFQRATAKRRDIAARVMRPGSALGPIQSLGRSSRVSSLTVAASPNGQAVVAWGTEDAWIDLSQVDSAWSVRAAVLGARAARFGRATLLDPGHDVAAPVSEVSAAIAPDGTATVLWTGLGKRGVRTVPYVGRPYPCPVRVATARHGGRFGRVQQLARNGAGLGVVTARDGTTTVLWGLFAKPEQVDEYSESLDRMYASRREPRARRFAPARALAVRKATKNAGSIALDPASQRPAALWIAAVDVTPEEGIYDFPPMDALYARGPDAATGPR